MMHRAKVFVLFAVLLMAVLFGWCMVKPGVAEAVGQRGLVVGLGALCWKELALLLGIGAVLPLLWAAGGSQR